MARILVLYGTTEGHTARMARFIGETLRARGHAADVIEAGPGAPGPRDYAGVIVAASVHGGRYKRPVRRWATEHAFVLKHKVTAFVSVCLGVLQQDPRVREEVAATPERFFSTTGWRPSMTKTFAGALLYTKYSWPRRWLMKRIVRKAGGDTDTTRDYEYTDWAALGAFAEQFGARVHDAEAVGAAAAGRRVA